MPPSPARAPAAAARGASAGEHMPPPGSASRASLQGGGDPHFRSPWQDLPRSPAKRTGASRGRRVGDFGEGGEEEEATRHGARVTRASGLDLVHPLFTL